MDLRCRRPNLGDLMIMIVALSLGLFVTRERIHGGSPVFPSSSLFLRASDWLFIWSPPWLMAMSLAALMIRLRRPRPGFAELRSQPGMVASSLSSALTGAILAFFCLSRPATAGQTIDRLSYAYQYKIIDNGVLVLGAWSALAMAGCLRRESGWIDGFGVLIGIGWISLWVVTSLPTLLYR
jgi:hypothetical protein